MMFLLPLSLLLLLRPIFLMFQQPYFRSGLSVIALWSPDAAAAIQTAAENDVPFVAAQPDDVLLRKEVGVDGMDGDRMGTGWWGWRVKSVSR